MTGLGECSYGQTGTYNTRNLCGWLLVRINTCSVPLKPSRAAHTDDFDTPTAETRPSDAGERHYSKQASVATFVLQTIRIRQLMRAAGTRNKRFRIRYRLSAARRHPGSSVARATSTLVSLASPPDLTPRSALSQSIPPAILPLPAPAATPWSCCRRWRRRLPPAWCPR